MYYPTHARVQHSRGGLLTSVRTRRRVSYAFPYARAPRDTPTRMARTTHTHARSYACRLITACVAALALASASSPVFAQEDLSQLPAHVLAHKRVVEPIVVEGHNMTVTITVTNAGESEARKVKVTDKGFPKEDFELITGEDSLSATYATLEPGASETYSFVVVPLKSGTFYGSAAQVSYLATSGRETTQGSSNVVDAVPVYTRLQKNIFTALKVGRYLTLGACKSMEDWVKYGTIIGFVVGVLMLNWVALKVKKTVAAMRRKMAVASLERSEKKKA